MSSIFEEMNAGYTITDRITVGNSIFVLGQSETAPAKFVIWKCKRDDTGKKTYFWGHYCNDRLTAVEDLCRRALEELQYLRTFQQEKDTHEKLTQQPQKKKHELER